MKRLPRHRAGSDEGSLGRRSRRPPGRAGSGPGSFQWASNTVNTYLSRLAEKGFVSVRREGRSNLYTPLVSQEDYLAFDSRAVLDRLYGSPKTSWPPWPAGGWSRGELEELQALLDQLKGRRAP